MMPSSLGKRPRTTDSAQQMCAEGPTDLKRPYCTPNAQTNASLGSGPDFTSSFAKRRSSTCLNGPSSRPTKKAATTRLNRGPGLKHALHSYIGVSAASDIGGSVPTATLAHSQKHHLSQIGSSKTAPATTASSSVASDVAVTSAPPSPTGSFSSLESILSDGYGLDSCGAISQLSNSIEGSDFTPFLAAAASSSSHEPEAHASTAYNRNSVLSSLMKPGGTRGSSHCRSHQKLAHMRPHNRASLLHNHTHHTYHSHHNYLFHHHGGPLSHRSVSGSRNQPQLEHAQQLILQEQKLNHHFHTHHHHHSNHRQDPSSSSSSSSSRRKRLTRRLSSAMPFPPSASPGLDGYSDMHSPSPPPPTPSSSSTSSSTRLCHSHHIASSSPFSNAASGFNSSISLPSSSSTSSLLFHHSKALLPALSKQPYKKHALLKPCHRRTPSPEPSSGSVFVNQNKFPLHSSLSLTSKSACDYSGGLMGHRKRLHYLSEDGLHNLETEHDADNEFFDDTYSDGVDSDVDVRSTTLDINLLGPSPSVLSTLTGISVKPLSLLENQNQKPSSQKHNQDGSISSPHCYEFPGVSGPGGLPPGTYNFKHMRMALADMNFPPMQDPDLVEIFLNDAEKNSDYGNDEEDD